MRQRVAALAAAVTLAWCAGCSAEPGTQPPAWTGSSAADLVATGITLLGGTGQGAVVVDGAGMAWVDGPWQVTRVDPATGAAKSWDAGDDAAFASSEVVAPAQPTGVWLRDGDTLRLFDGERFAVVLTAPGRYRGVEDGPPPNVLQVGSQLWVSGSGGVGRWADGAWSAVGDGQVGAAGPLAVDSAGAIWAGVRVTEDSRTRGQVVRWDGATWATPAPGTAAPAGAIGDITADPDNGVWVTSAREGTAQHGVFRFDGTTWTKVGPGGYARDLSVTPSGEVWAMVSVEDGLWGADSTSLARLADDGTWDAAGAGSGAPRGNEWQWPRLAVTGETRLLTDRVGLVRSAGQAYERAWSDPAAVVEPAFGMRPDGLLAVSAEELWMPSNHPTGSGGVVPAAGLGHYVGREWRTIDMPLSGDSPVSPVLATDGAAWQVGRDGLYRIKGELAERVAKRPRDYESTGLGAGPNGSVFALVGGSVHRVDRDGTTTELGHPQADTFFYADPSYAEGVLWVGGIRGVISRWDGRWSTVELPEPYTWATDLVAAGDGSLVMVLANDTDMQALGRFADGAWVVQPTTMRSPVLGPAGTVFALSGGGTHVVGLGPSLEVTTSIPIGGTATSLAIGVDGSIWVVGEQVARLPTSATRGTSNSAAEP